MAGDDLEPATGKRHQDLERNFITRLQRGERDPRGEQRQGALCKGFVVHQSAADVLDLCVEGSFTRRESLLCLQFEIPDPRNEAPGAIK